MQTPWWRWREVDKDDEDDLEDFNEEFGVPVMRDKHTAPLSSFETTHCDQSACQLMDAERQTLVAILNDRSVAAPKSTAMPVYQWLMWYYN
jgi:hypothetical protein